MKEIYLERYTLHRQRVAVSEGKRPGEGSTFHRESVWANSEGEKPSSALVLN